MKTTLGHARLAISLIGISGLLALVVAAAAGADTPEKAPQVKPIESLWLAPMPPFTTTTAADAAEAKIKILKKWQQAKVFDVVKHPKVPDRDLYIFDTKTDKLVAIVDTLGTLLYGLAVDSQGRVFIAQTDARNDANGRAGSKKHGLAEMQNRAFLNRITRVGFQDGAAEKPRFFDLEPLPPQQPEKGLALATPFAIQVSDDDSTLVVSAAGSDKLFTVDAASGAVLGRVAVGAVPRGLALECTAGKPSQAWVLNAVANTVSLVDVSAAASPTVVATIPLEDPTQPLVKRGRMAFNSASASTTGTYSCASCHPDGHTDQLLWVLDTPIVTGGNQIMPRLTMPVRGLRDTAPYHWDGIPGDPYGGINSANIRRSVPATCRLDDETSCTRHLIDGGLATTMHRVGDKTVNDEGKLGALSAQERDDMAAYLLSVPYPPAPRRSYTNVVSSRALEGFRLFHVAGDLDPKKSTPNVCGNCHRMPFLVSSKTPGTGMDAPTWRGAYDRWVILPQGRLNIIDFDFYRKVAEQGAPERSVWRLSWSGRSRFDPVWDMVLEGSTGFSGSFARQVTLNKGAKAGALTNDLLDALELSAGEGAIVLEGEGVLIKVSTPARVALQFDAQFKGGTYVKKDGMREAFTRKELLALAAAGTFVGTFTARHGAKADVDHPQPALWTLGPIEKQRGRQEFPILHSGRHSMTISGRHFGDDANVLVNGRRVPGTVSRQEGEKVVITLATLPPSGLHLLQVQEPQGMFSNDFIFHVAKDAEAAAALQRELDRAHFDARAALATAISKGDLTETKGLLAAGAPLDAGRPEGGLTPLGGAARYGQLEIARFLIEKGADVSSANKEGATPLHVAAFWCRADIVKLLLDKGASTLAKNKNGETPLDLVSSPWSKDVADLYTRQAAAAGLKVDLKRLEQERPQIARLLREHAQQPKPDDRGKRADK